VRHLATPAAHLLPGTERHPHARAVLGAALAPGGAPSHAYLFSGPAGSGKRTVARAFAAALLTEGAADPAGAAARVEHGAHPDLTWVAPASAAGILVGDVDQAVVAGAARTPFESSRRVFVIEDADELNDQAANRMLKTLEEPPSFAHLILLTSRPGEVLPTIASRCQPVRFDAPSVEQIAARLERHGVAPATADACARLGLGDAARALALALGDGPALRAGAEAVARGALRDEIAGRPWTVLLDRARAAGAQAGEGIERALDDELGFAIAKDHGRLRREAAERGKRAARRAQTAALDRGLALVGLWLRDVACVADGVAELAHHSDRTGALREDAALGQGAGRLRAAQGLVEETRASLQFNPNEELALDALGSRLARTLRI
jgi:DNA polymerase-3 subunit delta'